jgi:hypothetical protein
VATTPEDFWLAMTLSCAYEVPGFFCFSWRARVSNRFAGAAGDVDAGFDGERCAVCIAGAESGFDAG